ncbi:MAG: TonB-dependent receptor [Candidatus Eisenbacteria bacterium]|nr:TonB-dependent receptor [Candidatus Eisenbacteria bacterium]
MVEVKLRDANEKFQLGVTTATSSYGGRAWQVVVSGRDPIFQPLLHAVGVRAPGEFSSILDVSSSLYETRYRYLDPVTGTPWEQFQQNFFRPEPTYRLLSSYEDSFFGYHFKYPDMFAPAADNQWAARYGLTWKPSASNKLTFDFSKRIAIDQGFSRVRLDVNGLESDPAYPWRWQRRIDHAGTFFEDNVQSSVEWRRTLSSTGYFNLQLSRYFFAQRQDVQAKTWTDYEQPNDIDAFPNDSRSSDYFWDTGDDNVWADRHTNTISMVGSVVKRHHRNEMEMGLEHNFQSVQYLTIQDPWKYDPSGLGSAHDLWLVHPWVGDLYVRDRLEYEGFTANFGLRADYWFMGREVEAAIADTSNRNVTPALRDEFYNDTRAFFGRRYKLRWSPRIIVAHPITENSSFFFNYGIFTQIPSYQFVYSKLTSVSSESYPKLGNPNLNPEVSINYELGAKHQFTRGSAANLTFFVKDTYDYPDAVTYQVLESSSASGPTNYTAYLNGSFARSKGFEIEIEKRRTRFWSGRVTYTFSQTRGKSSDPNDQRASVLNGGTASETPVTEHFVTWNRPHKLGVSFDMRFDREAPAGLGWMKQAGLNLYVQGESGRAYTPLKAIGDNQTRAVGNTDSRNAPFQTFTDLKFNRYFKTSAGKLDFSVACKNLFSTHSINRVDPVTGQGRVWGVGSYDPVYFPNVLDNDPYVKNRDIDDPSNYGPGAQWRLQFDYDF